VSASFVFSIAFVRLMLSVTAVATAASAHAGIGVSSNGQATYGHAISVPPGIAGMAPNLSLAYAEGGVNGPVGVGWSVQGVSAITRCGASRPTDGVARAVDFSGADKLCLDGQRLIQTDTAGAVLAQLDDALGLSVGAVREFRTEKDTFARIRAYGQINASLAADGPAYIKVWTKSGQLYEYGLNPGNSDANAVITAQGRAAVMVWALRRVSDVVGNYIDFRYTQGDMNWGSGTAAGGAPGREWNVAEIQYTGTASSIPRNKVVFSYDARAADAAPGFDRAEAYQLNNKNVSTQRLSAVRTYINSPNVSQSGPDTSTAIAVRAYKLTYDRSAGSGRSRLTQITECVGAAETQCLPPVAFTYTAGGSPNFTASTNFADGLLGTTKMIESSTGNYGVLTGDFNGDGRTDILRWSNTPAENQLWKSLGGGGFQQITAFNLTSQSLFKTDGCYYAMVADFNGDGLSDILRVAKTGCSPSTNLLFLSLGNGTFSTVTLPALIDLQQNKAITGSSSVLCASPNRVKPPAAATVKPPADDYETSSATRGEAVRTAIGAATGAVVNVSGPCLLSTRTQGKRFYILDVNGDGIPDIVTTVAVAYQWNSGWGAVPSEADLCAGGGHPSFFGTCSRVFIGSANGSFVEKTNTNVINTSLYSDPPSASDGFNPYWKLPSQADITGDGLQDILASYSGRWRSTGDGNFTGSTTQDASQLCGLPIDFNGDGRADCLRPDATVAKQTLTVSYGAASSGALAQFNLKANVNDSLYLTDSSNRQTVGVIAEDFDGDGRQDLLRWGPVAATDNGIYLSNGDGSFRARVAAGLGSLSKPLQSADGSTSFILGDFLGNGAMQILHMKDNPSAAGEKNQIYARGGGGVPSDVLYSVTSATGLTSQVLGREPLSNSTRYESDRGTAQKAIAPVLDLQVPMYVITAVSQETGVGTVMTDYLYKGLKAERGGRGLLGFREVRQQSPAFTGYDLLTTTTEYLQTYPYTGVAALTQTYLGPLSLSGAQRLSRTTNAYCDKTSGSAPIAAVAGIPPAPCATAAKIQRPYIYQTIEEGWDLGNANLALPTTTTTSTYNDAGDPLTITMETKGDALGIAGQTFTKATTNLYFTENTSGDNWIVGRLQRSTVRNTVLNSLPSITTSAGTSANATARAGSGPPPVPASLPPGVLSAILQLLLLDD
jgi:hypothetical protein